MLLYRVLIMEKLANLSSVGIYITNVCNLNCDNCRYLNNFAFKGHQRWAEFESIYTEWSKKINFVGEIYLLGGEPMSNPDFLIWVHNIARLWPNTSIKINTNGTMLDRWPTLYNELLPYNGRVWLAISGHNLNIQEQQLMLARQFLKGTVSETNKIFAHHTWNKLYSEIRGTSWRECVTPEEYANLPEHIQHECKHDFNIDINNFYHPTADLITYIDSNNMRISWSDWTNFIDSAVQHNPEDNTLAITDTELDPSEPIRCGDAVFCHTMNRGKLSKCPVVSILPEFLEQFPVTISEKSLNLVKNYQPAEHSWSVDHLRNFCDDLSKGQAIEQCRICPSMQNQKFRVIAAGTKKIKIHKKT